MKWSLPILLPGLVAGYIFLFLAQEQHDSIVRQDISPALPTQMLNIFGHSYLNQIIAEALFIKTAVYYGGLTREMDDGNLKTMGQHFITMSQLHPKMLDIYYRAESVLAHRGDSHTRIANQILETGRSALPNQVALPFFEGFNYFYYLKNPIKAAEILRIASNILDAPQWIGHLASMLMGSGGNIRSGLIWLKGMLSTVQDEDEKARYEKDIHAFEKAMQVQLALDRYAHRHGDYPDSLTALVPADLAALPSWENDYLLDYQAPKLLLRKKSRH